MVLGFEGDLVSFNAFASYDPDGQPLDFKWNFGDGATDHTGTVGFTSHAYADNGVFAVQVTVTDADNLSAQAQCIAQITNVAPSFPCSVRGCSGGIPGGSILQGETFTAYGSFVDPGADTWIAAADYGDSGTREPLTLTGKAFTLSHRYMTAGTFIIAVLVIDDDAGMGTASNQVVVTSWVQALQDLAGLVSALTAQGTLSNGEANSLSNKLATAIQQINNGNRAAALNQLNSFINEVNALIASGRLQPADAQILIAAATRIQNALLP